MKFIELTSARSGLKIFLSTSASIDTITPSENGSAIFFSSCNVEVKETPEQIVRLLGDEKKDSEWIKNTGKAPDGDLVIEAKLIGDASTFDFDLDSLLPITEYKILGKA